MTRATAEALGFRGNKFFLELADGSDSVLSVVVADDRGGGGAERGGVGDGQLAATAVQQYNLHLGAGIAEEFRRGGWGGGAFQGPQAGLL